MLNFSSYKYKDLQHFMQILTQCETEGVTDIRFVRDRLHKHLYKPQKVRKPVHRMTPEYLCPKCKYPMYPAKGEKPGTFVAIEGKKIMVCGKCRYSEVNKHG